MQRALELLPIKFCSPVILIVRWLLCTLAIPTVVTFLSKKFHWTASIANVWGKEAYVRTEEVSSFLSVASKRSSLGRRVANRIFLSCHLYCVLAPPPSFRFQQLSHFWERCIVQRLQLVTFLGKKHTLKLRRWANYFPFFLNKAVWDVSDGSNGENRASRFYSAAPGVSVTVMARTKDRKSVVRAITLTV